MPAASAARSPSNWASTCWAPRIAWPVSSAGSMPRTSVQPTTCTGARRTIRLVRSRTASRETTQSRLRVRSIADVDHDRRTGGGGQLHLDAEQLADQPQLQRPLLEPAQAHRPGGQRDRVRFQAADPQHRHEDRPPGRQLDDQSEHPGGFAIQPQGHHDVPDLADRLATRPEHRQPGELGDEDSGGWRHEDQVKARGAQRPRRRGPECRTSRSWTGGCESGIAHVAHIDRTVGVRRVARLPTHEVET